MRRNHNERIGYAFVDDGKSHVVYPTLTKEPYHHVMSNAREGVSAG